jgi:hypothetical protein
LLTSLTISTSTHTNYFDRVVKERGAEPRLVGPLYRANPACQHPVDFLFFRPAGAKLPGPEEADHYNQPNLLVNPKSQLSF